MQDRVSTLHLLCRFEVSRTSFGFQLGNTFCGFGSSHPSVLLRRRLNKGLLLCYIPLRSVPYPLIPLAFMAKTDELDALPIVMTPQQVAKLLAITVQTLRKMVKAGVLQSFRVRHGVRFRRAEVVKLIRGC